MNDKDNPVVASLEEFARALADIPQIQIRNGIYYLHNPRTAHMAKLIQGQKGKKKSSNGGQHQWKTFQKRQTNQKHANANVHFGHTGSATAEMHNRRVLVPVHPQIRK